MIKKYGDPAPEGKVKVLILRGYQNYEIGSIVDLPEKDISYLEMRKVIRILKEDDPIFIEHESELEEKDIRQALAEESQDRKVRPQINRAFGLDKPKPKRKGRPKKAK